MTAAKVYAIKTREDVADFIQTLYRDLLIAPKYYLGVYVYCLSKPWLLTSWDMAHLMRW